MYLEDFSRIVQYIEYRRDIENIKVCEDDEEYDIRLLLLLMMCDVKVIKDLQQTSNVRVSLIEGIPRILNFSPHFEFPAF
jgi:hypothetical protein